MIGLIIFSMILYKKKMRRFLSQNIMYFMLILILVVLYYYELNMLNMNTYYSDARHYWELYLNRNFYSYERYFVRYMWVSNFFGLFEYPIFVTISNIGLFFLSVFYINDIMKNEYHVKYRYLKYVNFFLFSNGVIIFMCLRVLKDMLFVFLLIVLIKAYFDSYKNTISLIFFGGYSLLVFVVFRTLRPWAFGLIPIFIFFRFFNMIKSKLIKILTVISLILVGLYFKNIAIQHWNILNNMSNIIDKSFIPKDTNFLGHLLKYIVFALGPSPKHVFHYDTYFTFYTSLGNILILIGNIFFYYLIITYSLSVLLDKRYFKSFLKNIFNIIENPFLWVSFVFVTIYVIAYNGSVETRLRGVFYILFIPFIFSQLEHINFNKIKYLDIMAWTILAIILTL